MKLEQKNGNNFVINSLAMQVRAAKPQDWLWERGMAFWVVICSSFKLENSQFWLAVCESGNNL